MSDHCLHRSCHAEAGSVASQAHGHVLAELAVGAVGAEADEVALARLLLDVLVPAPRTCSWL